MLYGTKTLSNRRFEDLIEVYISLIEVYISPIEVYISPIEVYF
jgi:hypothetical protein